MGFVWNFFPARVVQGTTAVDFRLPEAARPVCVTGPGDEIFNGGFRRCRRSASATGSKTVNVVHIIIFTRFPKIDLKCFPCRCYCLILQCSKAQNSLHHGKLLNLNQPFKWFYVELPSRFERLCPCLLDRKFLNFEFTRSGKWSKVNSLNMGCSFVSFPPFFVVLAVVFGLVVISFVCFIYIFWIVPFIVAIPGMVEL